MALASFRSFGVVALATFRSFVVVALATFHSFVVVALATFNAIGDKSPTTNKRKRGVSWF